jgi:hypothetical protein
MDVIIMDLQRFVRSWPLFSFLILYIVGRTPWSGGGGQLLARPQPKHRINAHNTDIYASSVIRTHDPSVQASEGGSCLRPLGHCDRQMDQLLILYSIFIKYSRNIESAMRHKVGHI